MGARAFFRGFPELTAGMPDGPRPPMSGTAAGIVKPPMNGMDAKTAHFPKLRIALSSSGLV
jgi:hypothetical protein